jgi:hypothetical protein
MSRTHCFAVVSLKLNHRRGLKRIELLPFHRQQHITLGISIMKMKALFLSAAVLAFAASSQANAAGCLKGAAVGGVGGHFVGKGHAVLGAVGGCVVGRHMANQKARDDAQARGQAQQQQHVQASN